MTHLARRSQVDSIDRTQQLLAMPQLEVDTAAALANVAARTSGILAAKRATPPLLTARPARWLAAAAGVVIVATTLTMTGVADSILQIFEAKQFAAVAGTAADIQTLGQLSQFGELAWSSQPAPHQEPDLAAAAGDGGLAAIPLQVPASGTRGPH